MTTATISYRSLFAKKSSAALDAEIRKNQYKMNLNVPANVNKPYITVAAAAARLHVSKSTIYRWMHNGKLTAHYEASKAGPKRYFVDGSEIYRLQGSPAFRCSDADLH